MWAKIITIKRTKDLNYFSLCALNLFNTWVSQFELNYWNKWTFPRHSNLLRCTCMYLFFFFQKEQYLLFNISEGYTTFLFYFSWHNVLSGVISLILISIPLINGSYIYIYHDLQYVYIYTLGRCFYPKWLTLYSSSYKYYQLIYKRVYFFHK